MQAADKLLQPGAGRVRTHQFKLACRAHAVDRQDVLARSMARYKMTMNFRFKDGRQRWIVVNSAISAATQSGKMRQPRGSWNESKTPTFTSGIEMNYRPLFAFAALAVPALSGATLVTHQFSGAVSDVITGQYFPPGLAISGNFAYDLDAPNIFPGAPFPAVVLGRYALTSFEVTIGGQLFSQLQPGYIQQQSNLFGFDSVDRVSVSGASWLSEPATGELSLATFSISWSGELFETALLSTALPLNGAQPGFQAIFEQTASGVFPGATGMITSLRAQPVPEPSTLTLLSVALAASGLAQRRNLRAKYARAGAGARKQAGDRLAQPTRNMLGRAS